MMTELRYNVSLTAPESNGGRICICNSTTQRQ
jgi:hypothetical protein